MGKTNKKSHAEFLNELISKNIKYIPVEQYAGAAYSIQFYCPTCGHTWKARPTNILSGRRCPKCIRNLMSEKYRKTQEEFAEELANINPGIEILGKYINYNSKIRVRCKIHNIAWDARPSALLKGCGCKECMKEKIASKNGRTHDEFVKIVKGNYPHIVVLSKYSNAKSIIECRCKIHNRIFTKIADALVSNKGQCPICTMSDGAKKVAGFLDRNRIEFIPEYKFKNESQIQNKRFDFYISELNTCIEFDGAQHFYPMTNMGGQDYFEYMKHNDEIKEEYCKRNGIRLIRIPYTVKDIEGFLQIKLFCSQHEV